MTSPDGITWTSRKTVDDNYWSSVTYGNGMFVAVSQGAESFMSGAVSVETGNRVMTSPDGITWTSRNAADNNNSWGSVTYGNGLFVAGGEAGVMTSPDGITWTSGTSPGNSWFGSVTYGAGRFVAIGGVKGVLTSPDGIKWTSRKEVTNEDGWISVTYGAGRFVAVSTGEYGADKQVMTSPDGVKWTGRKAAARNIWTSVTYGNGRFVAVSTQGTNSQVMTSGRR